MWPTDLLTYRQIIDRHRGAEFLRTKIFVNWLVWPSEGLYSCPILCRRYPPRPTTSGRTTSTPCSLAQRTLYISRGGGGGGKQACSFLLNLLDPLRDISIRKITMRPDNTLPPKEKILLYPDEHELVIFLRNDNSLTQRPPPSSLYEYQV